MQFLQTICTIALITAPALMAQSTNIALPQVHTSGPIGLTATDAARWNVLNPPSPAPIVSPTCSVTLSFRNSQGQVIKTETVTLKAGGSSSLTLHTTDFPSTGNPTGMYALAVVPVTGPVDEPTGTCVIVTSMEIFDTATGKTSALTKGEVVRPRGGPPIILDAR
jgi:hypothetical protein